MKKKCYVLMVSEFFPATHPRSGQKTNFEENIKNGIKIHTIRKNYEFWKKRIDEIVAGNAYLSVRKWVGRPRHSEQIELFRYERLGIQKLELTAMGWFINDYDSDATNDELAKNDGLSKKDFIDWFKKYDLTEEMAIIYFTDFKYMK